MACLRPTAIASLTALAVVALATDESTATGPTSQPSAFDHEFQSIDGARMSLADWRGKVLLIVNTASFCGFTPQYEGLQKLWERYEAKGLVVIGVPSNDFGAQEPEAEARIKEFCTGAFGVTFPLTAKYEVKGAGAHPFYRWAVGALGSGAAPRWNFHKILVGRDGKAISAYPSNVTPQSAQLITAIETALGK